MRSSSECAYETDLSPESAVQSQLVAVCAAVGSSKHDEISMGHLWGILCDPCIERLHGKGNGSKL